MNVRRIVANNPSEMTGPGTNTYLVGIDEVAVIDPGPDDDVHLDAIVGCGSGRIRWILLTHTHPDHAPATTRLKARTGAEVCAFDDRDDVPVDRFLADGDTVETTEFRIRAIHTPGHASNHLCYLLEEVAEVVGRVARRVDGADAELGGLDRVAVGEEAVDGHVVAVVERADLGAGAGLEPRGGGGVVGVGVGEQDPADAPAAAADDGVEVDVVVGTGVDDRDLVDADQIRVRAGPGHLARVVRHDAPHVHVGTPSDMATPPQPKHEQQFYI